LKTDFKLKYLPKTVVKASVNWFNSSPFELSAIIAYYAILSLPALLVIILNLIGNIWGKEIVQGELLDEITSVVGSQTAESIRQMMVDRGSESVSIFTTIIGFVTLIYGSTGVFFQLQQAFDKIWEVKEEDKSSGLLFIISSRIKSFGFILIIGFLLLISFILTALISTFNKVLNTYLPDFLFDYLFILDFFISLLFIYALFATMFKYLPSKKISWQAVKIGAALTAILFVFGEFLMAWYFKEMDPGSTYGAAGSVILIMLWVSYSSLILFFGAHFTKVYSDSFIKKSIS
jgi:membrane protein